MAQNRFPARSRRGLHITVILLGILLLFTGSVIYPKYWNQMASATPLPALSEEGFRLGLDLQGGVHLVYEASMASIGQEDRANALAGVKDVIERRVNAFGVSEPVVQTTIDGDSYRIIVELAGIFDISDAIDLIGETPILEFKLPNEDIEEDLELTDEQRTSMEEAQVGEREAALAVLDSALAGENVFADAPSGMIDVEDPIFGELAKQIEEEDYSVGVIDGLYESESMLYLIDYRSSLSQDEVFLSHILLCHQDSERCQNDRTKAEALVEAREIADTVTTRTFPQVAIEKSDDGSASSAGELGWVAQGDMVPAFEEAYLALGDDQISDVVETEFGYHIIWRQGSQTRTLFEISYVAMPWTTESDILDLDLWVNTELSGKHVQRAAVAFDPNTGAPYVLLTFNSEGSELFGTLTSENIGNVIGMFLDGEAISTPFVQEAIKGGEASIQGNFTVEEAKVLVQRLNAGALPVPISLLSQQTVGPTLGAESLNASVDAAAIGILLLALFLLLYYRLPGFLAIVALLFYVAINLTLYRWLGVTLTLAGIAGFILSMGMAVDANVLIFERLKEELKSGRDLPTAIDEGFRRAWTSIRDGNLTTLIAAAVLFSMSTSFIKGFALTLGLGIFVSLFTALMVTRVLLKWVSSWKAFRHTGLYGVKK